MNPLALALALTVFVVASPDGPVLDRDVLAVERVDPKRLRTEAGGEATELEAVEIEGHVVGLDLDGVTRCHGGAQVASEAIDTLHRDQGGQRRDGRAVDVSAWVRAALTTKATRTSSDAASSTVCMGTSGRRTRMLASLPFLALGRRGGGSARIGAVAGSTSCNGQDANGPHQAYGKAA